MDIPVGMRLCVGRYERLVEDAVIILSLAREQFDEAVVRATARVNDSDLDGRTSAQTAIYSPMVSRRVLEVEADIISEWYHAFADVMVPRITTPKPKSTLRS